MLAPAASGGRMAVARNTYPLVFSAAVMCACLFLQRFGVPFGGKSASIVGPIGIALAAWGIVSGTLAFHRRRLLVFVALAACAVLGMAWNAFGPGRFGAGLNVQSAAQFLILTGFITLSFTEPVDEARFFRLVNLLFAIVAASGLLQFVAQFAGIQVFAFTGLLPDAVLFESGYNLQIPTGVGSLLKSNGFFLVEPSVFSQLMALALIIEVLAFRRWRYLALFAAGLLLSMSGTGWLVLASFVVVTAIGMGGRGLAIAVAMGAGLVLLVGAGLLLAPDLAGAAYGRLDEIARPGTSGHMRFVTPFWLLHDVLAAEPSAFLAGIGSGASEHLTLPYDYDVNTPVKIALEYGVPALAAYVLLFLVGRRTAIQGALVAPALVLILFTGGYQQFPPMLFLVMLVTAVARLTPATPR